MGVRETTEPDKPDDAGMGKQCFDNLRPGKREGVHCLSKENGGLYPNSKPLWRLARHREIHKNTVIDRILEDPFFKNSEMSYFIQLADFCAYALLRACPKKT